MSEEKRRQITDKQRLRFANFAFVLGECGGHLSAILEDGEILAEFIERGVSESDLKKLKEDIRHVARVYYI